jgi:SpoVK/Ycf46/Vps4 family AAA+-type ATPase
LLDKEKRLTMGQPSRIIDFGSLPRDPDRDAALVDARRPERSREEIVLAEDLRRKLDRIEAEYRERSSLGRLGLAAKSRLLFVGPPGCGKTLCAEVLAGDLGLTLLYARFDGIVSSYLGETASNLRRLFNYARQHQAVLFFDEFDALGKRRDDPHEVGELKRVVSSFLQLLDSYPKENLVVAATNHEGMLDEALWRRFDEILFFGKPTSEQLTRLMELRLRGVRKRDVDLAAVVAEMKEFTFADAERVCFEASKAMVLAKRNELSQDLLLDELREQKARIALATGRPSTPK